MRSLVPPLRAVLVGTLVAVVLVAVCGCEEPGPPTYVSATKAIVDAKCAGCHHEGGIGPMPLTSYEEIEPLADIMRAAIDSGAMPPWMADNTCNTYSNDFSLTDDEKATLTAWFDAGHPKGDDDASSSHALLEPAGYDDPLAPDIRVDVVLDAAPEPYTPARQDDYRCFAIPWPYDTPKYITAFDMIPGDPSNVHHVNIFLNPPPGGDVDDFVAYDDADPAPGYSCGRGDRVLSSTLVGAWAPGASGVHYPKGTGQLAEPGSSITLEVHYAHESDVPDASALALEVEDTVERRGLGAGFWWFNNWDDGGMLIPAGEASVTHEVDVDPQLALAVVAPWMTERLLEIHVAAVHMHELGTSGSLWVRSPVGDTCLLEIPKWDFHWQMGFELETPAQIFLGEDRISLSCTWDNSESNQPVVDGVQQAPRDVNWGGRTSDEMCIGFLYIVPAALD